MAISMSSAGAFGSSLSAATEFGRRGNNFYRRRSVVCATAAGRGNLMDQYRMLRVHPGATEQEVRKAFRQLALQYHPDVCKGSNCGIQFHQINEAYDIVINSLKKSAEEEEQQQQDEWQSSNVWSEDLWEEWMGWEGGGIRDYSSHINPYI